MGTNTGHVLTLANSIIGVSVLAMPFCFKQCGIALSILMLYFSSQITKLACHYLIKSAIMERMKNFEMLAFRAFGPTGKMMVELCIIGFMLGTCVAFFVIMGDLGPAIIGPAFGVEHPSALRPSVLIGVAVFVVLPLGLLRNVDSLSAICAASIAFYLCLVLKVVVEAAGNLLAGNWLDSVIWWRPSGILQCIPIFSMALSCQTQLFEVFDSLPNAPLERTNAVVRLAINMTTVFYIAVGFFGYAAYCNQSFSGNLMMNFSPTIGSEIMKIGFILSIAVSFPLVIFPCRASIYSFLYSKIQHGYEGLGSAHIPETKFQCITLVIVTLSLVIGLVMPNIEIVLGLIGSTIGVFICVIIPGMIFNNLSSKNTNEKLVAQFLVAVGLVIMVLGTYANLFATEEGQHPKMKGAADNFHMDMHHDDISFKKEFEKVIKNLDLNQGQDLLKKERLEGSLGLPKKQEPVVAPEPPPIRPEQEAPKIRLGPVREPFQPELPKEIPKKNPKPDPVIPQPPKEIVVAKKDPKPNPVAPEPPKGDKEEKKSAPVVKNEEIVKPLEGKIEEKVEIKDTVNLLKTVEEIKLKSAGESEPQKQEVAKDMKPVEIEKKVLNNSIENKENKKVENIKENLTVNMANGVPLPLAIKNIDNINKDIVPQPRDILKSDREKRDIERINEVDSAALPEKEQKAQKPQPQQQESQPQPQSQQPQPQLLQSQQQAQQKQEQIQTNKTKTDNEICEKTNPPVPNPPSIPDDLIKSPRHLSDGLPLVLDKKLELAENHLDIGPIPQKRDLKSLPSQNKVPQKET